MSSFAFRIKFFISNSSGISHEENELIIETPKTKKLLEITPLETESISESKILFIEGKDFRTREEALSEGIKVKNTLSLLGVLLDMGFDVGKEIAPEIPGKTYEYFKARGLFIANDVHGVSVFEYDDSNKLLGLYGLPAKVKISTPKEKFEGAFSLAYNNLDEIRSLSPKMALALSLFNQSHFEHSHQAKFITLVTAVECLANRDKADEEVIKIIGELIDITSKSNISKDNFSVLHNGLQNLKRDSISKSCQKLIKNHLGEDRIEEFKKYYEIRSEIVHDGVEDDDVDLGTEGPKLRSLVADLIKKC